MARTGVALDPASAPLDGGTTYRSGARFGPSALRQACYLPQDGSRPSLALRGSRTRERP